MAKVITKIKQGEGENVEYTPIGVDANNVFIFVNNQLKCSLQDLYTEWSDFKTNAKFMQYGESAPSNSQVKLWFQTPSSNNNS